MMHIARILDQLEAVLDDEHKLLSGAKVHDVGTLTERKLRLLGELSHFQKSTAAVMYREGLARQTARIAGLLARNTRFLDERIKAAHLAAENLVKSFQGGARG